ncbi:JmjC domain-containing protein 4, partial [Coemansia sp. RSA 2681]
MPLPAFIEKWQSGEHRLYCKDWHFTRSPSPYRAFSLLPHLSNDWLNAYYEEVKGDDYKFAYLGGQGTWTPFHEDVFRSYSWSANICGEKEWILVPPGQNDLFTDVNGNWVHSLMDYDERRFPRLGELKKFKVVQGPGETMFVPSGWWHQVRNVGDTISINHNWANEFNLGRMYERLVHDLQSVRYALSDVTDMDGFEDHVQLVLRANSGMDFAGFLAFVEYIAGRYLQGAVAGSTDPYFLSPGSVRRALGRIDMVLELLGDDPTTGLVSGHTYPVPLKSELPRGPLKSTSEYALEDVQTVVESLCTDITTGLHSSNAMQRQEIYGRNVLESEAEENLVVKFVKSIVTNSMVMLLLGSAGVSVLVGNWDDA